MACPIPVSPRASTSPGCRRIPTAPSCSTTTPPAMAATSTCGWRAPTPTPSGSMTATPSSNPPTRWWMPASPTPCRRSSGRSRCSARTSATRNTPTGDRASVPSAPTASAARPAPPASRSPTSTDGLIRSPPRKTPGLLGRGFCFCDLEKLPAVSRRGSLNCRPSGYQPQLAGLVDGAGAGPRAELVVDLLHVPLDGALGHPQAAGDLPVAQAVAGHGEDLQLVVGEAVVQALGVRRGGQQLGIGGALEDAQQLAGEGLGGLGGQRLQAVGLGEQGFDQSALVDKAAPQGARRAVGQGFPQGALGLALLAVEKVQLGVEQVPAHQGANGSPLGAKGPPVLGHVEAVGDGLAGEGNAHPGARQQLVAGGDAGVGQHVAAGDQDAGLAGIADGA